MNCPVCLSLQLQFKLELNDRFVLVASHLEIIMGCRLRVDKLPVIFTKLCKHEGQVSGFSTFDKLEEEFVFSLITTINTFFGLAQF
jgi:hypothetical protein